jgi:hypothetical protein
MSTIKGVIAVVGSVQALVALPLALSGAIDGVPSLGKHWIEPHSECHGTGTCQNLSETQWEDLEVSLTAMGDWNVGPSGEYNCADIKNDLSNVILGRGNAYMGYGTDSSVYGGHHTSHGGGGIPDSYVTATALNSMNETALTLMHERGGHHWYGLSDVSGFTAEDLAEACLSFRDGR